MDAIQHGVSLEELADRRSEVRDQLADAWQQRKSVSVIRRLEQSLIAVWSAMEEAEMPTQREPIVHVAMRA